MKKGKRSKKRAIIITLVLIFLAAVGLDLYNYGIPLNGEEKIVGYFEDNVGVTVNDLCLSADGEVSRPLKEEDFAYICIEIDEASIDALNERFEAVGLSQNELMCEYNMDNEVPLSKGYLLGKKKESEELLGKYAIFAFGRVAKTREIQIYVTKDNDGKAFIYMFG